MTIPGPCSPDDVTAGDLDGDVSAAEGHSIGQRNLAGRTLGVTVLATLGSVFDGVTAIATSRALGPAGRGIYAITLTVAAAVAVTACLGVTTAARVALASAASRLKMSEYLGVAPLHVAGGAMVGVLATAGLVVGVLNVGNWELIGAAGAVTAGLVSSAFAFDALHAVGRHLGASGSNTVGSATAAVLSVALTWAGIVSEASYLFALSASLAVQVGVALVMLRRHAGWSLKYRRSAHAYLLRSGLPALPFLGSTLVTFRLDRYLVGTLAGVDLAGIYSVAATLSEAARQLPSALGQVLLFGRASGQVSSGLERRSRLVVVCTVVLVLIAIAVVAEPLVEGLFGPQFADAVWPLRILLVGEVFIAMWLIDSRLLVGSGRLAAASTTTGISAVVLIAGDVALIPPFGIRGAALASLVAYAAAAATAACLLRRRPGLQA